MVQNILNINFINDVAWEAKFFPCPLKVFHLCQRVKLTLDRLVGGKHINVYVFCDTRALTRK